MKSDAHLYACWSQTKRIKKKMSAFEEILFTCIQQIMRWVLLDSTFKIKLTRLVFRSLLKSFAWDPSACNFDIYSKVYIKFTLNL